MSFEPHGCCSGSWGVLGGGIHGVRGFLSISFLMQLYELDGDPRRKEFLDDLFSFMQKRGEFPSCAPTLCPPCSTAPTLRPPHPPQGWGSFPCLSLVPRGHGSG